MGININTLANGAVTSVSNNTNVKYYRFKGIDNTGQNCVNSYDAPLLLSCQIQTDTKANLTYSLGYPSTTILKGLFVNLQGSGLNWALQLGQDKVVFENLVWYVVQVANDFNNQTKDQGWVKIVVAQSTEQVPEL